MFWNSGRRISAAAYGSAFIPSAGILTGPAAFPFFTPFIASIISLFEGSLMLIDNSGGKLTGSSPPVKKAEVLSISSRNSFHLRICPSVNVIVLPSLSLIGTVAGHTLFFRRLI
jgi:hypothetical protein